MAERARKGRDSSSIVSKLKMATPKPAGTSSLLAWAEHFGFAKLHNHMGQLLKGTSLSSIGSVSLEKAEQYRG